MASVPIPSQATIRGRDLGPLLKGETFGEWDNAYYGEYSTLHQSHTDMRCWRTNAYKLVRDFKNPERDEFYDLKKDPGETTNLINTKDNALKQVIAEFDGLIHTRMVAVGDRILK
ncbi:MAG: hypothetical protein CMJ78_23220 [Planctomycetaceae bacterium]|nr:hypothetical protein [Planctomycetaceae bacterium]